MNLIVIVKDLEKLLLIKNKNFISKAFFRLKN